MGNARLLLGIIGVFRFLGIFVSLLLGGFGTPWVGGPRRGFRKYLRFEPCRLRGLPTRRRVLSQAQGWRETFPKDPAVLQILRDSGLLRRSVFTMPPILDVFGPHLPCEMAETNFRRFQLDFPQILVDLQFVSIDSLLFSISFSHFRLVLINFNQFQSVGLGQKRRNLLTPGRWGKEHVTHIYYALNPSLRGKCLHNPGKWCQRRGGSP